MKAGSETPDGQAAKMSEHEEVAKMKYERESMRRKLFGSSEKQSSILAKV